VDKEYICRPAPKLKPRRAPAIGANRLKHYFEHPKCIAVAQETVFAQLPKRLGSYGRLRASPSEEAIGWGVHIEEGWHQNTIVFLSVILVLFSLLFGVIWSVRRSDMQGGFAVSGCGLTLATLLMGCLLLEL
jgi:hypothetical protein